MLVKQVLSNEEVKIVVRFVDSPPGSLRTLETMKSASIVVFVFLFLAHVNAERSLAHLQLALTQAFSISVEDVNACFNKTSATLRDFMILEDSIDESFEDMDRDSIRRASCVGVCCAQVQGTMVGAQLQLPVIHKMVKESNIPLKIKHGFHNNVDICYEQVKNIEDECEVGYHFIKCLIIKYQDMKTDE